MEHKVKKFSLKEIEDSPDKIIPDIKKWVDLFDKDPKADGWELRTEGSFSDDFKDCTMTIHTHSSSDSGLLFSRMNALFTDIDLEKFKEFTGPLKRKEWDDKLKKCEVIKKFDENLQIIYMASWMPFPMTDRDFLLMTYIVHNQKDKKLYQKLGLPKRDVPCYVGVLESIDLEEVPEDKNFVRAEMFQVFMMEESKDKKGAIIMKTFSRADMKGNFPDFLLNQMVAKGPKLMMGTLLQKYHEQYDKK